MVESQHPINSPDEPTSDHKSRSKRDSYNHTYDEQRRCFLYDVFINHFKIKDAAEKYSINYSTAKTILRVFKDEGRIDKKTRKKEAMTVVNAISPDIYPVPLAQECLSNQQTSHNSSVDSFESMSSLGSLGSEIRRVRTLPIPQNLFYLGMMHGSIQEEEKEVIDETDVNKAIPCDLKGEFWTDALKRADTLGHK